MQNQTKKQPEKNKKCWSVLLSSEYMSDEEYEIDAKGKQYHAHRRGAGVYVQLRGVLKCPPMGAGWVGVPPTGGNIYLHYDKVSLI